MLSVNLDVIRGGEKAADAVIVSTLCSCGCKVAKKK